MGNLLSKNKKIENNNLITNIYCEYCKQSYLHNKYYKNLYNCKKKNINMKYGDL